MLLKTIVALVSLFILFIAYGVAASGDDRFARYLFTAIAVVALLLVGASIISPVYDRYLTGFVIGVVIFLVVVYSLPMSVWRAVGLAEGQQTED